MTVKQLSVFVQNTPGRLAEITTFLADNNINIRAISMADTTEFGILRLIVDQPEKGAELLKGLDFTVSVTEVLAVEFDDSPGALARVLTMLADHGIGVEYAYAFSCDIEKKACIIMKPTDILGAAEHIEQTDFTRLFKPEEVYFF